MIALPHPELPARATSTSDLNISNCGTQYVSPLRKLKLSERETQILDGLAKGHANKVIARVCGISEATVKVHMKSILQKIQVANRTQAAIWALETATLATKSKAARRRLLPRHGAALIDLVSLPAEAFARRVAARRLGYSS